METTSIRYTDGTALQVSSLSERELEDLMRFQKIKHSPTENWNDCYEVDGNYLIKIPKAGFILNSLISITKFLTKTAFLKDTSSGKFIFFELIEQEKLVELLNNNDSILTKRQSLNEVDVFGFSDGRILVADKYLRGAEIFMSSSDYCVYQKLMPS